MPLLTERCFIRTIIPKPVISTASEFCDVIWTATHMPWGSVMTPISVLNASVSRFASPLLTACNSAGGFAIGRVCGRCLRCRRRRHRCLCVCVGGRGGRPRVRVWILGAGGGAGREATACGGFGRRWGGRAGGGRPRRRRPPGTGGHDGGAGGTGVSVSGGKGRGGGGGESTPYE